MKYTVRMTPTAEEQVFQQYRYIAVEQQSPKNADAWWSRIFEAIDSLNEMPYRCPLAEENEHKDYEVRKRGVGGFNLLFTVFEDKKEAWIIATRGAGMEVNPERLPQTTSEIADERQPSQQENQRGDDRDQDQGMER